MRGSLALLASLGLACGCAAPPRQEFEVGVHRLSMVTPAGWQHVDQGRRHLIRRGDARLVIEDLGPRTREGIRDEIQKARERWRAGSDGEGRTVMRGIEVAPRLFESADQRQAFWSIWHAVAGSRDFDSADLHFDRLLTAIDGMRELSLDEIVDDALQELGEDQRRSRASLEPRSLDGRNGAFVVTWNRLSHADPRTFAIFVNRGRVLALRVEDRFSRPDESVLEDVLESLGIVEPADQSGVTERRSST